MLDVMLGPTIKQILVVQANVACNIVVAQHTGCSAAEALVICVIVWLCVTRHARRIAIRVMRGLAYGIIGSVGIGYCWHFAIGGPMGGTHDVALRNAIWENCGQLFIHVAITVCLAACYTNFQAKGS